MDSGSNFNGDVKFIAKDATDILGYTNPQKAIRDHVDEDDKGVNDLFTPGGVQNVVFINESGLYSLILSSKNRIICPIIKTISHFCRITYSF